MPKRKDLFEIEGLRWEEQSPAEEIYALHVPIPGRAHVCCWSYPNKKQYFVQRYIEGVYNQHEDGQWLDPMEAMCVVLEAQKEVYEIGLNSTSPPRGS